MLSLMGWEILLVHAIGGLLLLWLVWLWLPICGLRSESGWYLLEYLAREQWIGRHELEEHQRIRGPL